MRLREHIEAERSALVLLVFVIPVKRANADLERNKLLAGVSELLVSFLYGVIIVSSVIYPQRVAYKHKKYVSDA